MRLMFTGDILMVPILKHAGKDISHWFNPKTGQVCGRLIIMPDQKSLKHTLIL